MVLLAASTSFAWTRTLTFEGGTNGAQCKGGNGFDDSGAAPYTTFSNTMSHSGSMSCKMHWTPGEYGFPDDMGQVNYSAVGSGGEIWARGYYYFPTGFSFNNQSGGWGVIKTLRLYSNSNPANSIFIETGQTPGLIVLSNETGGRQSDTTGVTYNTNTKVDIGAWQSLEIYVKFAADSSGIIRIWKNGTLVLQDTGHPTSQGGGGSGTMSYVMSYWNSGCPATQDEYLDDFTWTSDTPSNVDAAGNHMIGPIGWGSTGPVITNVTGTEATGQTGTIIGTNLAGSGTPTVVISNSSTQGAGTVVPQTVTSSSATSVQFTFNFTGLTTSPIYVYETNGAGITSPPYTITGNPSGADTTPPVTTATPGAGTYASSQTISLSCADNVACAASAPTHYCWGASCNPTTVYSSPLAIQANTLRFYSTDAAGNNEAIQSLVYAITATDTVPPVISGVAPSGTLPYGTTSQAVTFATDKTATCKWDTTDGTYSGMANTITPVGAGTSWSYTVTGLTNGGAYNYYMRCANSGGYADTTSTVASFNVSNTAPTNTLLFAEPFDDANIASRGWYDNTTQGTIVSGGESGNALQWAWTQGQTIPLNGGSSRHAFTPNEEIYISFWVKFQTGWRGSEVNYHPHIAYILSDQDGAYAAPGSSYLDTYLEFVSQTTSPYWIYPQMALQDNFLVNTATTPPNNMTASTENRSVNYCNGCKSGQDCGNASLYNCFSNGSVGTDPHPNNSTGTEWYSMDIWRYTSTNVLTTNAWHQVEYHLKMNTVTSSIGNADGVMQAWVDGTQVINSSTIIYRTNQQPTKKFAQFVLAPYIGVGSPITQTMWFDDLTVSSGNRTTSADTTPPTVTAFTIASTSTVTTVPVTAFTATDNVGVTAYCVTTTNSSNGCTWAVNPQTSVTFSASGAQTAYGWAKDAAGNISSSVSSSTTITPADTTPPVITAFTIPATSTSPIIPVTLTATDNVGVFNWCVLISDTNPADCNWLLTSPTSVNLGSLPPNTYVLSAYVQDAAGNLSTRVDADVAKLQPPFAICRGCGALKGVTLK